MKTLILTVTLVLGFINNAQAVQFIQGQPSQKGKLAESLGRALGRCVGDQLSKRSANWNEVNQFNMQQEQMEMQRDQMQMQQRNEVNQFNMQQEQMEMQRRQLQIQEEILRMHRNGR